jgi:hypothetical protein
MIDQVDSLARGVCGSRPGRGLIMLGIAQSYEKIAKRAEAGEAGANLSPTNTGDWGSKPAVPCRPPTCQAAPTDRIAGPARRIASIGP